jgi:RNA recognition motif-containing protein
MNIFVSNLSFQVESNDLKDFFTPYGEVSSSKVITDRESGRSRGFGFVEMPSDDAGNEAISKLNGAIVDGRALSVTVARPKDNSGKEKFNKRKFF